MSKYHYRACVQGEQNLTPARSPRFYSMEHARDWIRRTKAKRRKKKQKRIVAIKKYAEGARGPRVVSITFV